MKKIILNIIVNGRKYHLRIAPNLRLLDLLRDELRLTGTKEGCGIGECGACTVLVNGSPVNSCLVLAGQCEEKEILTIEGLENGDKLDFLQQSFIDHGAIQCGFCIPGMIMSARALLNADHNPSESKIKEAISGNLCRCTGYGQIIEAIKAAADRTGPRAKE